MTQHTDEGPCQCPECRPYRPTSLYTRARVWLRSLPWGGIFDCLGLLVLYYGALLLVHCSYS